MGLPRQDSCLAFAARVGVPVLCAGLIQVFDWLRNSYTVHNSYQSVSDTAGGPVSLRRAYRFNFLVSSLE